MTSDYKITIERLTEEGFFLDKKSVRKYIFVCDETHERLMPIINSLPAESREESAPPAASEPEPEFNPFDASIYRGSNKMIQILMVLSTVFHNQNEIPDTKENIVKSIKFVAKKLGIEPSTIYDKIIRRCGDLNNPEEKFNMEKFNAMVADWLQSNSFEALEKFLKDEIAKSYSPRVLNSDLQALTEFKKTIS